MSIFRIYSTFKGLHLIKPNNKKEEPIDSVEKVIDIIESAINRGENAHYLVVETNIEQDTDIPYLSIWDDQEFYDFKDEYFKQKNEKTKGIR